MGDCAASVELKVVINRECDNCLLSIALDLFGFILFHEIDLIACRVPEAEIEVGFPFLDDELFLLDKMPLRKEIGRFVADDVAVDSGLVFDSNISLGINIMFR